MREAEVTRKTRETEIAVRLNLDGEGRVEAATGVAFLDHMIRTLGVHSRINIEVQAKGDLMHHIVEDVGLCLGEALRKALGDGAGITRFGCAVVPMDDALALAAVDLVTRPYAKVDLAISPGPLEDVTGLELLHFLEAFTMSLRATVHIKVQYGVNDHHKAEASLKALALSLRQAVAVSPDSKGVPSAKGSI